MTFSPTHLAVTGRGGAAVWLVLRRTAPRGVLLAPANLCYAALYPALYAGWSVRFCDVDPADGNLTYESFHAGAERHRPDAAILPHMYGQPIRELPRILALCRERSILTIEDCASAMGAEAEYPLGRMGDYTLYSTGYAKPIQVGFGGLLTSETDPLDWVRAAQEGLPVYDEAIDQTETLFSRLYRVLRNEGEGVLEQAVYAALPEGARRAFLFRLDAAQEQQVLRALGGLEAEASRRRAALAACEQALRDTGAIGQGSPLRLYPYTAGAMPWRLSLFAPAELRARLIPACLNEGLPVSDWYPRVTPMFGDAGEYPGALEMERTILNFPLSRHTAERVCPVLARLIESLTKE